MVKIYKELCYKGPVLYDVDNHKMHRFRFTKYLSVKL